MIQLNLAWALILGESLLVLAVSLGAVLFLNARRRRQDRQAALHLVGVIKKGEGQRLEETRTWLESAYGLREAALDSAAHALLRAEKLLYQRVVNLYIKRDRVALRALNIDVEAVGEALRGLQPASAGKADAPVASGGEDDGRLRAENEALKQELQITMETMSRMLGEYAAMFGGGPQGAAPVLEDLPDEEEQVQALDDGVLDLGEESDGVAHDLDALDDLALDDKTVALDSASADGAEVDLSDEAFDSVLGLEDEDVGSGSGEVREDSDGNEMDGELADVWAEALAEQDEGEKDK